MSAAARNAKRPPGDYPDQTFERLAEAAGANVRVMWEERGPIGTAVAWHACYDVNGSIAMVQTFREGGWNVLTSLSTNDIAASVADALNRCGVPAPAKGVVA